MKAGWSRRYLALGLLLSLGACEPDADVRATPPSAAAPQPMLWQSLGSWSGRGDRQTESFDVTSGALRLVWEAHDEAASGSHLRVTLHSSISGRPLETLVDAVGAGADTLLAGASPRVAYLRIESEGITWRIELQEGARGNAEGH